MIAHIHSRKIPSSRTKHIDRLNYSSQNQFSPNELKGHRACDV